MPPPRSLPRLRRGRALELAVLVQVCPGGAYVGLVMDSPRGGDALWVYIYGSSDFRVERIAS